MCPAKATLNRSICTLRIPHSASFFVSHERGVSAAMSRGDARSFLSRRRRHHVNAGTHHRRRLDFNSCFRISNIVKHRRKTSNTWWSIRASSLLSRGDGEADGAADVGWAAGLRAYRKGLFRDCCLLHAYYHIYNSVDSQGREKAGNGLGAADETHSTWRAGDVTAESRCESGMLTKCAIADKLLSIR